MKEPPAQISSNDWEQYLQSQLLRHEIVHAGQGVVQLGHIAPAALVVAKSALLRFPLKWKTSLAPLFFLSPQSLAAL